MLVSQPSSTKNLKLLKLRDLRFRLSRKIELKRIIEKHFSFFPNAKEAEEVNVEISSLVTKIAEIEDKG